MAKTLHGMCHTRLYHIWNSMKQRCENPKTISYKYYGEKGITVCNEWRKSFLAFYDWAVSHGYTDGLTLDRKSNDGNYEPTNCRWATPKEQLNHTSYTREIELNGVTKSVTEWAEFLGIPRAALYHRLQRG